MVQPTTAGQRRTPVGRIVAVVLGCLLLFPALGLVGGGSFLLWVNATQRDAAGFFSSRTERLETTSFAIVSEHVDLRFDPAARRFLSDFATVRLRVSSATDAPVFIGIGPRREVEQYLDGVARAQIEDVTTEPFGVDYRYLGTGPPAGPPGERTFWTVESSGSGTQTIRWPVESGEWVVVVMNADGSAGVGVDASVGLRVTWLGGVAVGMLIGGVLLLILAVALLVAGLVGLVRHEHPPQTHAEPPEGGSPVRLSGRLDPELGRWLWLVKWLLVIPHLVVLVFLWIAFAVLTVVAWFAIVFTGRYPRAIFDFNVGVLRWSWRVSYYSFGVNGTDRYPPFQLRPDPTYPADLDVAFPERLSRGLVWVKSWLLAIPHYVVVALFVGTTVTGWSAEGTRVDVPVTGLITWLVLVAVVVLLFTGRYLPGLHRLLVGLHRWVFRVVAYAALMTDEYPPFRLDQGEDEPDGRGAVPVDGA